VIVAKKTLREEALLEPDDKKEKFGKLVQLITIYAGARDCKTWLASIALLSAH
jgi:hypothetical protein